MSAPRSFAAELAASAHRAAEKKIRGAITRLNERITDVFLERYQLHRDDVARRAELNAEQTALEGHVFDLRCALGSLQRSGHLYLGSEHEAALRAADTPRRSRATTARSSSSSTVTPAPAEVRALPAPRARGRKPAPPAPERVINLGGRRQLLLGPATGRDREEP